MNESRENLAYRAFLAEIEYIASENKDYEEECNKVFSALVGVYGDLLAAYQLAMSVEITPENAESHSLTTEFIDAKLELVKVSAEFIDLKRAFHHFLASQDLL